MSDFGLVNSAVPTIVDESAAAMPTNSACGSVSGSANPTLTRAMVLSFLFFHSMACIGDFGMASYFYENRDRTIYTFDDMENEKSYFFELKQEI